MTTKTMPCVKQGLSVLQLTKMEALANAYKPTLRVYIFIFIYLFLYSVILYFIQFNLFTPFFSALFNTLLRCWGFLR